MKKLSAIGTFVLLALPAVAFAQASGDPIGKLIQQIGGWTAALIPILVGVAVVAFFWGLVRYIWGGGEEGKVEGRKIMIAGISALFVMIAIWGIIKLVQDTLGVDNVTTATPPNVKGL